MLMERGRRATKPSSSDSGDTTPHASGIEEHSISSQTSHSHAGRSHIQVEPSLAGVPEEDDLAGSGSELRQYLEREAVPASERTPLLAHPLADKRGWRGRTAIDLAAARNRLAKITFADMVRMCIKEPIENIPAVMLGLLLNVLDGVSYGMIL
jgi:hypothetical protein